MKWQRARMIGAGIPEEESYIGRTFWVEATPPQDNPGGLYQHPNNGKLYKVIPHSAYRTNILISDGKQVTTYAERVELLGGPDAFADDVPTLTWEEFVR